MSRGTLNRGTDDRGIERRQPTKAQSTAGSRAGTAQRARQPTKAQSTAGSRTGTGHGERQGYSSGRTPCVGPVSLMAVVIFLEFVDARTNTKLTENQYQYFDAYISFPGTYPGIARGVSGHQAAQLYKEDGCPALTRIDLIGGNPADVPLHGVEYSENGFAILRTFVWHTDNPQLDLMQITYRFRIPGPRQSFGPVSASLWNGPAQHLKTLLNSLVNISRGRPANISRVRPAKKDRGRPANIRRGGLANIASNPISHTMDDLPYIASNIGSDITSHGMKQLGVLTRLSEWANLLPAQRTVVVGAKIVPINMPI